MGMIGVCLNSSTGLKSKNVSNGKQKLTWKELVRMDDFQTTRDISVHSKHASNSFHIVFVVDHLKWNWNSELEHLATNQNWSRRLTFNCESPARWISPYMSTSLLNICWFLMIKDSNAVSLSHSSYSNKFSVGVNGSASSIVTRSPPLNTIGAFSMGKPYLKSVPLNSVLCLRKSSDC